MNSIRTHFQVALAFMRFLFLVLLTGLAQGTQAQVVIDSISIRPDGQVEIRFPLASGSYYILRSGPTTTNITSPTALRMGGTGTGELLDPGSAHSRTNRFYQIQQVPLSASLDLDGDGISDAMELSFGSLLNGLDPADGAADPDGDGMSTADELRLGRNPFVKDIKLTTFTSSPFQAEAGVSVNRETVLRFSRPLAADTTLSSANLRAAAVGRSLLTRADLSSDRLSATLFYLEPIPGAARVRVTFDASAVRDDAGQLVDADADGIPGGIGVVEFDTFGNLAVPNTAVIGRVFASELGTNELGGPINRPLAGVIVTVDGAEETLRALTDTEGRFNLSPAPSGRIFVHIDGRPALGSKWPGGPYYPVVGKAWEVVAGKTNNLAGGTGEIFLPLIAAGALQAVSATHDTTVGFPTETLQQHPELAGVQLIVPSNSLFADNGSRGGRVGIAPVPADRLPGPLPEGVRLPLVITVQTDGPLNLDRPAPVQFPNLPDPDTGITLPPGAKTALISFNHDTGEWEIAGSMTISADGRFAMSDPGSGIRQPGWHGTSPLCGGSGGGYGGGGGGGDDGNGGNRSGGSSGGGGGDGGDSTPPSESGYGDDPGAPDDQSPGNPGDPNDPFDFCTGCPIPCGNESLAEVKFKLPHFGSGAVPPENFVDPNSEENGKDRPYRVIPNQVIKLTFKGVRQEGDKLAWKARSGVRISLTETVFKLRYDLNISTHVVNRSVFVEYERKDGGKVCEEIRFFVLPNSGAHWKGEFSVPATLDELVDPFRSNLASFIRVLTNAHVSVSVKIAATFRPQKRAYLMHMAGKVKMTYGYALDPVKFRVNEIPDHDPFKGILDITFAYFDLNGNLAGEATTAAAEAMCSAFGIAFPAGYPATRHGYRRAVDMTIRWEGTHQFELGTPIATGTGTGELYDFITISAQKCSLGRGKTPDEHCNNSLWLLGSSWKVNKLAIDKPHWSDDGF